MEDSSVSVKHCADALRRCAQQLLTIGENRAVLLTVEVQEERNRMLSAVISALGVAAVGLLAGMTFSATVVVLTWNYSHAITLSTLSLLYLGIAMLLFRRLMKAMRDWQAFSASLEQLRKDRACLQNLLA
jgi:uncharacterized membrane protein YqjE